jgi:hypothetical protein
MLTENRIFDDMKEHFGESRGYFLQDDAPANPAQETMTFIQEEINMIPDWPVNSPDLSAIENV